MQNLYNQQCSLFWDNCVYFTYKININLDILLKSLPIGDPEVSVEKYKEIKKVLNTDSDNFISLYARLKKTVSFFK